MLIWKFEILKTAPVSIHFLVSENSLNLSQSVPPYQDRTIIPQTINGTYDESSNSWTDEMSAREEIIQT